MESAHHDLGHVLSVDAEAIGQPGQRRFRLSLRSSNASASLWLEKEQLAALGEALAQMNERLDQERGSGDPDVEPLPLPNAFDIDLRASRLGIGYEAERELFAIHAFDAAAEDTRPALSWLVSRGQSRVLSRRIASVVAAGRPLCPLCDAPVDPEGHVCPRSNGHRDTQIVP